VKFKPNPAAARELASSPDMARLLERVADQAAGEAQRRLPYPRIMGGITVEGDSTITRDGAEGRVVIHGSGWHLWEFGTKNHPARPAIRPGVQDVISRFGGRWKAL
jgi:hypothetical protein